jgi:hypothetical protein
VRLEEQQPVTQSDYCDLEGPVFLDKAHLICLVQAVRAVFLTSAKTLN